jgi:hypothetical protein
MLISGSEMTTRKLKTVLFAMLPMVFIVTLARAQQRIAPQFHATIQATSVEASSKSLILELSISWPGSRHRVSMDNDSLDMWLDQMVTIEELRAIAEPLGFSILTLERNGIGTSQAALSFPFYINSGDNVQDDERYEALKQEWIRNNPEAYRAICNCTHPVTLPVE